MQHKKLLTLKAKCVLRMCKEGGEEAKRGEGGNGSER